MFAFTESEREFLNENGDLVCDEQGREVYVGLTYEETEFLALHRRAFGQGIRHHENKLRAVELSKKHEAARLARLGAAHGMRVDLIERAKGKP